MQNIKARTKQKKTKLFNTSNCILRLNVWVMPVTIIFFTLCSSVVKILETPVYRTNLFNIIVYQRCFQSVLLIEVCGSEIRQKSEWSAGKIRKKQKNKTHNNSAAYSGYTELNISQPLHRICKWTLVSLPLLQLKGTHRHSISGHSDQGSEAYDKATSECCGYEERP